MKRARADLDADFLFRSSLNMCLPPGLGLARARGGGGRRKARASQGLGASEVPSVARVPGLTSLGMALQASDPWRLKGGGWMLTLTLGPCPVVTDGSGAKAAQATQHLPLPPLPVSLTSHHGPLWSWTRERQEAPGPSAPCG